MGLQSDIEKAFDENLNAGDDSSIENIAKLIADYYKDAIDISKDSFNNYWIYDTSILENAIKSQFELSLNTETFLQFSLIESALVASWMVATLKLPAIPPSGVSIVNSGIVVSSVPPATTTLDDSEASIEDISKIFADMFINHANSISYQYIGLSTAAPPTPITIPSSGISIE